MPSILFIGAHRLNRSPSQRFRFEQYFSFLERNRFACHLSPLLDEADDRVFYSEGNLVGKAAIVVRSYLKRRNDLKKAGGYDIVFIQREALMTGSVFFERALKRKNVKVVFDFDDAIWLPNVSEGNRRFEWLKNPSKTAELIGLSDLVIAGNQYLADYAKQYNGNVCIIPTTIDTEYHRRKNIAKADGKICIGWTGSHTTIPHFEHCIPVFKELMKKYGSRIYFKVIGDEKFENAELNISGIKWGLQDEIAQLSEIDIGVMPLPDNEWTKGKCGCKGLQYMALGIPSVMSEVGMNREIVTSGVNGFLAENDAGWMKCLSLLIEDPELRKRIGAEARKTVEERYSCNSQKEKFLGVLKGLLR